MGISCASMAGNKTFSSLKWWHWSAKWRIKSSAFFQGSNAPTGPFASFSTAVAVYALGGKLLPWIEIPGLIDDAMGQRVVMCSPLTLFAFLGVIRQAFDNFMIEQTSDQILGLRAIWREMQIREEDLAGSQHFSLFRRRLLHLHDKLRALQAETGTIVMYEAPHRLAEPIRGDGHVLRPAPDAGRRTGARTRQFPSRAFVTTMQSLDRYVPAMRLRPAAC